MNFIIQKDKNGLPAYGFCYETIKSIEYNNWISQDNSYKYTLITLEQLSNVSPEWYINYAIKNRIPVGSVEFVHKYMEVCGIPIPPPKNIPEELFSLCLHEPQNVKSNYQIVFNNNLYLKSNDQIKHPSNGKSDNLKEWPIGNWQITKPFNIISEWRCFIFKERMVDARCYSGEQFMTPAEWYIDDCIEAYKSAPIAYTLDIAICPNKDSVYSSDTVIEVHDTYSCGLYGFEGKYPALMQAAWWKEYTNRIS